MSLPVIIRASLVAAALAAGALLALPARAQEPVDPVNGAARVATLSMSGTAEIGARPDRARITSGVVSEAETARAALDANSEAVSNVIAALRQADIEERDIQTSGFSVEPRYQHYESRNGMRKPPDIVGYSVSNQVSVLVRNLDVLGPVLDEVVSVGANQINGIQFEVSNADQLLDAARNEAFANAMRKASLYAEAADVSLKRVLSIRESGQPGPPRPMYAQAVRAEAAQAVPVQPGEQTLRVQVDIVWEIGR